MKRLIVSSKYIVYKKGSDGNWNIKYSSTHEDSAWREADKLTGEVKIVYPDGTEKIVTGSTQLTSGFSFDFIYEDDYDAREIESSIFNVFENKFNLEVTGIDFHSVDYEDVREYSGENISQCGVDFSWENNYQPEEIVNTLSEELESLGYSLIGYDFYSL